MATKFLIFFLFAFAGFQSINADGHGETNCSLTPVIKLGSTLLDQFYLQGTDKLIITSGSSLSNVTAMCEFTGITVNTTEATFYLASLESCHPLFKSDNDTLYVTWQIVSVPSINVSDTIQRYSDNCINVTCAFDINLLLNTSGIVPTIEKILLAEVVGQGEFAISIDYVNENYTALGNDPRVYVPEPIYVRAELDVDDPENYVLQAEECWATPTSDETTMPRYDIIEDGCAVEDIFESENAITVVENYMSYFFKFYFDSFVWTGIDEDEQKIYVFCYVKICHVDSGVNCTMLPNGPCPANRKRRDVPSALTDGSNRQLISSGPIYIHKQEKETCAKNNGGCSDVCELREGDVFCSCFNGKHLNQDGKTCTTNDKEMIVLEMPHPSVTPIIALALIASLVLLVGGYMVRSSKQKISAGNLI
ncbi:alpha-tectorin-like [Clavelina lepadiformis]|uniref:alpha-tectorin-like n=1 Tax=Clavelina lepadiformis TaxID=159417 RepID=UPI0040430959